MSKSGVAKYPQPLTYLVSCLEITGHLALHRFPTQWQNSAMYIYNQVWQFFCITALMSHILSTTTRSIRYMPEFYQKLLEDFAFTMYIAEAMFYNFNYKKMAKLMNHIETQFSLADQRIVADCVRVHNIMFYGCLVAAVCTFSGSIIETFFPVTSNEVELLRYVYKRKHPERMLQTNFWIPYIDDSESPFYETIYFLEFYLIFYIVLLSTISITAIPIIVKHLTGQYTILCQSIEKLARERQYDGTYIYYTNFETNEYHVRDRPLRAFRKEQYEQDFCHQLIRFHQKLLKFQDELHQFYSPNMFIRVLFNNLMFALCLYQLTVSTTTISKARRFKLIIEFISMCVQYFYLCHYSDILDDCNTMIERSINKCAWYKCSVQTRRDLCMLLRRVQKPNHLRFYDGIIILNRYYFLRVVKLSYSLVNFMKMKASPQTLS